MKTKGPLSRVLWCLAALMLGVGAYAWLGFHFLPDYLRAQLRARLHEQYGIDLRVDALELNPFSLRLQARGMSALDAQKQPLFEAEGLTVDVALLASLWQRAYVLSELDLNRPVLHVSRRRDGTLNLTQLASRQADDGGSSRPLRIETTSIRAAQIRFVGFVAGRHVKRRLQDLTLSVHGLSTDAGANTFTLAARTGAGAALSFRGSVQLAPLLESRGTFAVQDFPLRELEEFVRDALPLSSVEGRLSMRGTYGFTARSGARSEVALDGLSVRRLRIVPRQGAPLSVDRLQLTDVRVAPLQRVLTIGRVTVVRPRATLTRQLDGTLDTPHTSNTPDRHEPVQASSAPAAHSASWDVRVHAFEIERGQLELRQHTRAGQVTALFTPIDLSLRELSLDETARVPTHLSAGVASGGRFTLVGHVLPSPPSALLDLTVADVELAPFSALVEELAPLRVHAGALDVQGRLTIDRDAAQPLFAGGLSLKGVRVGELGVSEDLVRAQRIDLEGLKLADDAVVVQRLRIERPHARVVIDRAGKLNLAQLQARTKPERARSQDPNGELRIAELELVEMSADFSDLSTKPQFALPIRGLSGVIAGLSSRPGQAARVALRGDLGHGAPVAIQGSLQPFAPTKQADIRLRADNISLAIFNPYSGPLAGYSIERGELSTDVHYRVIDERLRAEHDIRIDRLKWGDATADKPKAPLPVKLATVLLRDRKGVIRLDLPLQGTLGDPSFRVGPLIWQAIKNVFIKAASAPFDMLGKWFRGAERARDVEFPPGETEPTERSRTALAALTEALVAREELTVEVPTKTLDQLDRAALADRKVETAIDKKLSERRKKSRQSYAKLKVEDQIDLLEDLYKERTGKKASLDKGHGRGLNDDFAKRTQLVKVLRDVTPVTNEELMDLGRRRAEAVERRLLANGRLPATRVIMSRTGVVSAAGALVKLRLELQ
jgi:uncharacterized protein involved in outer membrane biogenesis